MKLFFFLFFFFCKSNKEKLKIDDISFCIYTSIETYEERLPQMIETWYKDIPNLFIFSSNILPNIENLLKNKNNINITVYILNITYKNYTFDENISSWDKAQFDHSHFMKKFYEINPNKKWYVLCDDDTYIYTDQLIKTLEKYDSSKELILGRSFLIHDSSYQYVQGDPEVFQHIHGGSGLVMSNPFVSAVIPHILDCTYKLYPNSVSDARIMLCAQNYIQDSQQHLIWVDGFNALPPTEEKPIVEPPISYHKVFGNTGYRIWNASNSIWKGFDNNYYYTNWINYTLIENDILIHKENSLVHFMFGYSIHDKFNGKTLEARNSFIPIFSYDFKKVIAYYQEYGDDLHRVIYHCDNDNFVYDREIFPIYQENQKNLFEINIKCPPIQKYNQTEGNYQILFDNDAI